MIQALLPTTEAARLHILHELELLDSAPEEAFEALARLASQLLGVPIAAISFVDAARQWFKAQVGLSESETSREISFCSHTILAGGPLVVPDARADERFAGNPLVTGDFHLRAYAGVPLRTADGHAIGTLCAVAREPRAFSAHDISLLSDLAGIAQREIRSREAALSARKQADASLLAVSQSESLYQATFQHAAIGIAIVGLDGSWIRMNPTLCRIVGRTAPELAMLTFQDITHPEDLDLDLGLLHQLLDGRLGHYSLEKRYLQPDGTVVWTSLTVALVRDEADGPQHFVSIVEDISERRAADKALHRLRLQLEERVAGRTAELQRTNDVLIDTMYQRQRSEEALARREADLHALLNNAHEAYICIDPSGMVVEWNRQAEMTFGWSRDEAMHRRLAELIIPLAQRHNQGGGLGWAERAGLDQRLDQRIELSARRRDGTEFPCEVTITAQETQDRGRLYAAFLHDISERKQAEQLVAETNARLEEINRQQHRMLDNELVAIVKMKDRRFTWVNRAFELMTGYAANTLIGMSTRALYASDGLFDRFGDETHRMLGCEQSFRTQLEIVKSSGERAWIDTSAALVSSESGETLWMMLDVTAMRLQQSQAETLAYRDVLTGLPNRLMLVDRLQQAVVAATRAGQHVAICFLDLNGFKAVNDLHGHQAGDTVLREVARRLCAVVRGHDTVSRLGGDEFVILLTQLASPADCRLVLARAEAMVAEPVLLAGGGEIRVSASFGVAMAPDDGADTFELIALADAAMYATKRGLRTNLPAMRPSAGSSVPVA